MDMEHHPHLKHQKWGHYLLGTLMIIGCCIIGQTPLILTLIYKSTNHSESIKHSLSALMDAADLSPNLMILLSLLVFAFGLLGLYLVAKYFHNQPFKRLTTQRKALSWKRFLLSFFLIGVFILVSTFWEYTRHPENFEVHFKTLPFLGLLGISLALVPLQAGFEEYLFRGYLMRGFERLAKNKWVPLIATSILFGLAHYINPQMAERNLMLVVYFIGTGFFLGVITLMDKGLELALGFHVANNIFQILLITAEWNTLPRPALLKQLHPSDAVIYQILIQVLIIYPLFILIFAKVFRWEHWKSRLFGKI